MRSIIDFINTHIFQLFVFLTIIYSVVFFVLRRKLLKTSYALAKKNIEIKSQRDELKNLNQKLFASSLKIDQQNLDLKRQYNEIKIQKENVIKKTVDLLVVNRELRENLKLREGLTNMIVHDLKNPISNIINLSENKEITYFSNEILTMVENILDVQKYEGVVMSLEKRSVYLNKVIIDAEKQISLFAERKNIKIINKIKKSIKIYADEEILRRVIVNFLSNSIKYSYANSSIVVASEVKDNRVKVKVIDTGIGIKKDKIHLIFDKFSQVMAKKTGSARSSGLGLAFCKIAVQSHGGEINVESDPNKNTVFSFDIELSNEEENNNNNIIYEELDIINLSVDDKKYLMNFYKELSSLEVYEIGKLRKIINKINDSYSTSLLLWKTELNKSIYNCNFDLYKELINKII